MRDGIGIRGQLREVICAGIAVDELVLDRRDVGGGIDLVLERPLEERRHRQILLVRHLGRNEIVPLQRLATSLQITLRGSPGPISAPIFLGVEQHDQRHQGQDGN